MGSNFNQFFSINDIPPEMIQLANDHDFPLIVFHQDHDCRYVDLLQHLHTAIINQSYKEFLEVEKFLKKLYLALNEPHDINDILKFMHVNLHLNIAFFSIEEHNIFVPQCDFATQNTIIEAINHSYSDSVVATQKGNLNIAYKIINICNRGQEFLVIFSNERPIMRSEMLILEKCSLIIAQELLTNYFNQEKERQHQEQWIADWLNGSLDNQKIIKNLQTKKPFFKHTGAVLCIASFNTSHDQRKYLQEWMLNITSIARSFFEQQGFHLLCHQENQSMFYILLDQLEQATWKPRLKKAINQIRQAATSYDKNNANAEVVYSIGRISPELKDIKSSLEKAKAALYIQQKFKTYDQLFYDDLHVYRIIMALEKQADLKDFVKDYLQPVIDYDRQNPNNNLLSTLKAICDYQHNKQKAAKHLYIARQTLYQRIKVLEELLGDDFLSTPEKRTCLEIALHSLDYLDKGN